VMKYNKNINGEDGEDGKGGEGSLNGTDYGEVREFTESISSNGAIATVSFTAVLTSATVGFVGLILSGGVASVLGATTVVGTTIGGVSVMRRQVNDNKLKNYDLSTPKKASDGISPSEKNYSNIKQPENPIPISDQYKHITDFIKYCEDLNTQSQHTNFLDNSFIVVCNDFLKGNAPELLGQQLDQ